MINKTWKKVEMFKSIFSFYEMESFQFAINFS